MEAKISDNSQPAPTPEQELAYTRDLLKLYKNALFALKENRGAQFNACMIQIYQKEADTTFAQLYDSREAKIDKLRGQLQDIITDLQTFDTTLYDWLDE